MAGRPLYPTELIGSYALPGWLIALEERAAAAGDLGEADIAEALDDAVNVALFDQESAGVDVVTDGEMRRRDFIQGFYGRLSGLMQLRPARRLGAAGYDQNPRYRVEGPVRAADGLGIVDEVAYLRGLTERPIKVCVPGPVTLSLPLLLPDGRNGRDAVLADMIAIVNAEMRALVAAGATYLQIDEPRYATSHAAGSELVEVLNATRDGVQARVGVHLCFGNFKGRSRDRRDYRYLFPALTRARCDQLNFEFANRELAQLELLAQVPAPIDVGVGVVDVKSYFVEDAEQVAAALEQAARHVDAARIVAVPDCGFNHCPRHVARAKLQALTAGARLARQRTRGGARGGA